MRLEMSDFRCHLLLACLIVSIKLSACHLGLHERQIVGQGPSLVEPPIAPILPPLPGNPFGGDNSRPPARNGKPAGGKTDAPRIPPGRTRNCKSKEDCDVHLKRIVFSKDCQKTEENNQITNFLNSKSVDGKVYISMNNDCRGIKGVTIWLVKLTSDHVQEVLKLPNVKAVEIDRPLKIGKVQTISDSDVNDPLEEIANSDDQFTDDHLQEAIAQETPNQPDSSEIAEAIPQPEVPGSELDQDENPNPDFTLTGKRRSRLVKRSKVFRQQEAPSHLVTISTPIIRTTPHQVDYLYPESSSNKRITVYHVDSGARSSHEDFARTGIIKKWLFSIDLPQENRQRTDWGGHGTCTLSIICGLRHGVFKDPDVVVAKIRPFVGSELAVLQVILNDLIDRTNNPNKGPIQGPIQGHTVISMSVGNDEMDENTIEYMEVMFEIMIEKYQTIIVAAAGNSAPEIPNIHEYPAKLAGKLDIIAVGAVDLSNGEASDYSQGGPLLTVSGPGAVECASTDSNTATKIDSGTSFATAATSGLIAGLLSGDLGDRLRRNRRGVVVAVKECVQELAKQRGSGVKSIWNGVDYRLKAPNYGWPPTNLKCLD